LAAGKGIISALVGLGLNAFRTISGSNSALYAAYLEIGPPLKAFFSMLVGPVGFLVGWVSADYVLWAVTWIFLTAVIFLAISIAKGFVGWIIAATLVIFVVVFVFGGMFGVSVPKVTLPVNGTGV
jgi:hypothetical protein